MATTMLAASGTVTTVARFEVQDAAEVAKIWSDIRSKVIQLAGGDEKKIKENLNIDDVLKYLDQAQQNDKKSADKYGVYKKIFDRTLQCIQTVGGIVSEGASNVFAPSGMCFNALTFVIEAWQGYNGIFESLAELLEKCMEFLDRLRYYMQGGIDSMLAKVTSQHLQLFVEICDRTIRLRRSKGAKFIAFTKVLFLKDPDVKGLLDMMENLVNKEGRLVAAQTFNFSSEAAANSRENLVINQRTENKVDSLVEDRMDQKREKDTQKRRQTILKALDFDDDKMDLEKKEPSASWKTTYNNYRKAVVKDTGDWILKHPQFTAWQSGSIVAKSILALEGPEGSGKSYLASTIIRHLQSRTTVDAADSRTPVVAFYFLEADSKEGAKKSNSLDVVSKSLVWQFTQADASYQKSVAAICDKKKTLDPQEIWTQLLADNKDRPKIEVIFYIVIDGLGDRIDEPFVELLRTVSDSQDRGIRVLLTGIPRSFEILEEKGLLFETTSISLNNHTDVEKYIDFRMDSMEALKDVTRLEIPELRIKIRDKLKLQTGGDYFKLATSLDKISALDSVGEIDEVLEHAGEERKEQIIADIDKLNKTRTAKEISEINEISLWIMSGRQWFKPYQMDAILYKKGGVTSLLPLETKIKTKYSLFKVDSDGDVNWKSSDIVYSIPEKGKQLGNSTSILRAKEVQPAEVAIVEHFLNTVCPPELYLKFGFEEFFKYHKNGRGNDYIYKDKKDNAEIKLALTCLRLLTETRDEKTQPLHSYAEDYLLSHLSAVDLALADQELKTDIGPLLLKLFTDSDSIDTLLWNPEPDNQSSWDWKRSEVLYGDEWNNQVLKWFRDSAVVSNITDEAAKSFLVDITPETTAKRDLLEPTSRRMAVHWLREPSPLIPAQHAFFFLLGIKSKMEHQKDNNTERVVSDPDELTLEQITEVEDWAQSILAVESKDSLWEVQVAIILKKFGLTDDATKRCRSAMEIDKLNWRACHTLANLLTSVLEGIKILVSVTDRLSKDEEWIKESEHKVELSDMFFDLAAKLWFTDQFDQAVVNYTRCVELNPTEYLLNRKILEHYHEKQRWPDIIALLEALQNIPTGKTTCFVGMACSLARNAEFHEHVRHTAIETGRFDLLDTMYSGAIDFVREANRFEDLYYLRYYYGTALTYRPDSEAKAIAMWELALRDDLPRSSLVKQYLLPDLILALAPLYLRLARTADPDSDTAKDYLTRISDWLDDEALERNILYPAKLFLARYYQTQGDKVRAKEAARGVVKVALEMLSDDDEENDDMAYWRLLMVLIPLEDDENALAAWTLSTFAVQSPEERGPTTRIAANLVSQDIINNLKYPFQEDDGDVLILESLSKEKVEEIIKLSEDHLKSYTDTVEEPGIDGTTSSDGKENGIVEGDNNETTGGTVPSKVGTQSSSQTEGALSVSSTTITTDENEVVAAELDAPSNIINNIKPNAYSGLTDEENGPGHFNKLAGCDGDCGLGWKVASKIWCCRDCIGFQFDEGCHDKLLNGKLRRKICDPTHEFLWVPKWDEEKMRAVPRGKILVGNEIITLEEWKARIRKRYVDFDEVEEEKSENA